MNKVWKVFLSLLFSFLLIILGSGIAYTTVLSNRALADINAKSTKNSAIYQDARLPKVGEDASQYYNTEDSFTLDNGPRINILLLGHGDPGHPGELLTDTIQVFSFNTETNKAVLISFPRDLYLNIEGSGYRKLNEAYQTGLLYGQNGETAKKTLTYISGLPINGFASVNFSGFKDLINSIGGIDINVEKDLVDDQPGNEFSVSAGWQHMDGELALKYARSRKTTSDFDRSRRQQQVLIAIKNKIVDWKNIINPFKLQEILSVFRSNLQTDLNFDQMFEMLKISQNLDVSNIQTIVIDNNNQNHLLYSTMSYAGSYILLPYDGNFNGVREFIQSKLP